MLKTVKKNTTSPYDFAQGLLASEAVDGSPTIWHIRGGWHAWTGTHYTPVCGEVIEQRVLRFLKQRLPGRSGLATIRNVVNFLRIVQHQEIGKAPCWLNGSADECRNLFVVRNGVLQLSGATCELLPHDARLFSTAAVAYDFIGGAKCSGWTKFLDQLWPGDLGPQKTLQEWFGYCLTQDTSQQKILAVYGPPGSGKSTIARALTGVLGRGNVASPSIRDLSNHFGLWGLLDKKLAIIPDAVLPRPCPALEELLKSLSGEDSVNIHRKGLPPLTGIRLGVRLMVLANELPAFQDPSGALKRRLITLRTTRSFFGNEDVHLTDRLLAELPGILNWSIDGLRRLTAQGRFSNPDHQVSVPQQTTSPDTGLCDGNVVNIAAKLQQGKKAMAERCQRVGKAILEEAGVKDVQYHNRLGGWACPDRKLVCVPTPTTRRRLYFVAHEEGHVALDHIGLKPTHRQEYEAERYAHNALRRHGISVSKKSTQRAKRYVARKISQAIRRGAKTIDRESLKWCQDELSAVDRLKIERTVLMNTDNSTSLTHV